MNCQLVFMFDDQKYMRIESKQAVEFLLPRHYSGRIPSISYAFGVIEDGMVRACVTFGIPASPNLCRGVCGDNFTNNVIELNRLCRDDDYNEPLSKLVSFAIRELKKIGDFIIVSYADTAMNHNGYIYQATNFLYTGKTTERTDIFSGDGKHSRHYKKDEVQTKRKVRSAKHRYVFFATSNKRIKKQMQENLRYKIKPYPKGKNKNYVLGEYIQEQTINI